jgi:hypothetical protein
VFGGLSLLRTGGPAFFTLHRTLRFPALRDPPSPSITPGTDARRGERTLGIPRLKLALVQRRLYRLGCLCFLGCVRVRPGTSFIGLYGLPRGFWIVNIWEQRGKVNDLPPKRVISCRSLRGAGLRGAEGCHRPDRRPRVRRRPACASARRTSPSGRTGRAPFAPVPRVSTS